MKKFRRLQKPVLDADDRGLVRSEEQDERARALCIAHIKKKQAPVGVLLGNGKETLCEVCARLTQVRCAHYVHTYHTCLLLLD